MLPTSRRSRAAQQLLDRIFAADPDDPRLLKLGFTPDQPLAWLAPSAALDGAKILGLVKVFGEPRPDNGRTLVIAKTPAGLERWTEMVQESARRFNALPELDPPPPERVILGDSPLAEQLRSDLDRRAN